MWSPLHVHQPDLGGAGVEQRSVGADQPLHVAPDGSFVHDRRIAYGDRLNLRGIDAVDGRLNVYDGGLVAAVDRHLVVGAQRVELRALAVQSDQGARRGGDP
jgi:hypothetical protein